MKFDNMSPDELDAYWKGVEVEQDRIIKLLEENSFADWVEIKLENLIALIKGEK